MTSTLVDFGQYKKLGWTWEQVAHVNPSYCMRALSGKLSVPPTSSILTVLKENPTFLPVRVYIDTHEGLAEMIRHEYQRIYFIEVPLHWMRGERGELLNNTLCDVVESILNGDLAMELTVGHLAMILSPTSHIKVASVWIYDGPLRVRDLPWIDTLKRFYYIQDGYIYHRQPELPSSWFKPSITIGDTMCNQFKCFFSGQRDATQALPSDLIWNETIQDMVQSNQLSGASISGMASNYFQSLNPYSTQITLYGTDEQLEAALSQLKHIYPQYGDTFHPRKMLEKIPVSICDQCPDYSHLLVFDTETTSLLNARAEWVIPPVNPADFPREWFRETRLIQASWAVVDVRQWKVVERDTVLIRPSRCELTPGEIESMYPPSKQLWDEAQKSGTHIFTLWHKLNQLLNRYASLLLVCHNVDFDHRVIAHELSRTRLKELYTRWRVIPNLCTAKECNKKRLQDLHSDLVQSELIQTHRADDDVNMLLAILPHLSRYGWVPSSLIPFSSVLSQIVQ